LKSSSRIQEILCKVQKALRRMPGVSSAEAEEVNAQLQEAGQATSQEISQLVDALMNVTLDGQDVEGEIARLTLRYTLAKADAEDKARRMADLTDELEAERQKLAQAKANGREIMGELQTMTADYRSLREAAGGSKSVTPPARDELIKIKVRWRLPEVHTPMRI
jgi:chromosome segregation ATPase